MNKNSFTIRQLDPRNEYASSGSCNNKLVNNTAICPKLITLTATQTGSITYFFLGDACGAAVALGMLASGNANGTEFTVDGAGRAPLKELLKSYALVIDKFDFASTEQAEMSKNMQLIYTDQAGDSVPETIYSVKARSNMAENPLLLNLVNSFLLTNQTAIKLPVVTAGAIDTLTFYVKAMVPYGKLDEYLVNNKSYKG